MRALAVWLCLLAFCAQALAPHSLVLCTPEDGAPVLEFGMDGRCITLGGDCAAARFHGHPDAGPQQAVLTAAHAECSDYHLAAGLYRQDTQPLCLNPAASSLCASLPQLCQPAAPPALLRRSSLPASVCGPPGGLACLVLRI